MRTSVCAKNNDLVVWIDKETCLLTLTEAKKAHVVVTFPFGYP
jgi:hypothetical protein